MILYQFCLIVLTGHKTVDDDSKQRVALFNIIKNISGGYRMYARHVCSFVCKDEVVKAVD